MIQNLKNELKDSRETIQEKEQEITRLQGINQQFFLKLTQQDNEITKPTEPELNSSTDTMSIDDLIYKSNYYILFNIPSKMDMSQGKDSYAIYNGLSFFRGRAKKQFRYQILMRISSDNKEILDRIFYTVNKYNNRNISVVLEVNPNNLT